MQVWILNDFFSPSATDTNGAYLIITPVGVSAAVLTQAVRVILSAGMV